MSSEDLGETYPDTFSIGNFSEEDDNASQHESESPRLIKANANGPLMFFPKSVPVEINAGFSKRRNATATADNVKIPPPDAQADDPETLFAMSCSPGNSKTKQ